ncbi:MAG: metallophosphoesterase [Candidatus Woesearchaeota archaeon]
MKLLAFVDLHGSLSMIKKIASTVKKEDVDCIICAGDVTIFGDSMKQLVRKLDGIGPTVFMLHGNHEDRISLKRACENTKNVKFMHKAVFETDEYVIMAYGGGGFSTKDAEFEKWTKEAMKTIGKDKKIILVTHAPPYGTKLDLILDQPAGNKSIRAFIEKEKPVLAISGHLHENSYVKDKIGKTIIVNPGPGGMVFEV